MTCLFYLRLPAGCPSVRRRVGNAEVWERRQTPLVSSEEPLECTRNHQVLEVTTRSLEDQLVFTL